MCGVPFVSPVYRIRYVRLRYLLADLHALLRHGHRPERLPECSGQAHRVVPRRATVLGDRGQYELGTALTYR